MIVIQNRDVHVWKLLSIENAQVLTSETTHVDDDSLPQPWYCTALYLLYNNLTN